MSDPNSVAVLALGGTIDKILIDSTRSGGVSYCDPPAVSDSLRRLRFAGTVYGVDRPAPYGILDSGDMHYERVVNWCCRTPIRSLIITLDINDMLGAAGEIAKKNLDKTIVLTGALHPASMRESDADVNIGFAFAAAQLAPPGVYIAMNGVLHIWHECVKTSIGGFRRKIGVAA